MANVKLSIDEELLKQARILAIQHNTTVNAMIRDYLEQEVSKHEKTVEETIKTLDKLFAQTQTSIGEITWNREEIHER